MATKSETKKHIEAILGEKLDDDAVQLIQLFQSVALTTNTPSKTTQKHLFANFPNRCFDSHELDVSGFATTASNGQSVFRLTSFMCPAGEVFRVPVNVVATPFSSQPFFLTVTHAVINNGADVEIKVFAWKPNGTPAPGVTFNWRCRVELPHIIL
jgi:hypothetical protein